MHRNGFSYSLLLVALFSLVCGCQDSNRQAGNWEDDLTAQDILSTVTTEYAKADSYSDKGVLYLSYRLNGSWIQEPQPFSTSWTIDNQYAANLFNAQIRCDGRELSCYVFDIDTGNLDDQHLMVPVTGKIPLTKAIDDKIASHFVKGFSEMPIDETQKHQRPDLLPSVIGLLTNLTDVSWLTNGKNLTRLPDQEYEKTACFVLQVESTCGKFNIWVDKMNGVIHQMELPIQYLDSRVLASQEITDLSLVARFHEAKLNNEIEAAAFAIKDRPTSTLVRHFVSIPEAFPCELIGKQAPNFGLNETDNKMVARLSFEGQTTALHWLGGADPKSSLKKMEAVRSQFDSEKFNFGIVYSDSELADPTTTKNNNLNEDLQSFITSEAISTQLYCDRGLNAATLLKLKAVPSVLVMDKAGKIQFAVSTSADKWDEQLEAALTRVDRGENVAAEMKGEYQSFLDSYHEQLLVAGVNRTARTKATTAAANIGGAPIKPEKLWTNTSFTKPGNIIYQPTKRGIFVLDGYRTVCELNRRGETIKRFPLDIPENHAVNQLRAGVANNKVVFAGFSMLGQRVFMFDENWKTTAEFPKESDGKISDCQFVNRDAAFAPELLVSFADETGIVKINGTGKNLQTKFAQPVKSFADNGHNLLAVQSNDVVDVASGRKVIATGKQRALHYTGNHFVSIGSTGSNAWQLTALSRDLRQQWTAAIGSQFFENEIAPFSWAQVNSQTLLAIASKNNEIEFYSESGNRLGQLEFNNTLTGLQMLEIDGKPAIVVSLGNRIECWKLSSGRVASRR